MMKYSVLDSSHVRPAKIQISEYAQSDQILHWAHFRHARMQSCFMRRTKTLFSCAIAQADLNLRWMHMSESTFSDVAVQYVKYTIFTRFTFLILLGKTKNSVILI